MFNNPIGYGEGAIGQVIKQPLVIFGKEMSLSVHVSSITYFAPIYGPVFFACFLILFFSLFKKIDLRVFPKTLSIILIVLILISNPMQNYILLWVALFLSYGFKKKELTTPELNKSYLINKMCAK